MEISRSLIVPVPIACSARNRVGWDRQGVVDQHVHADRGARPLWKKDERKIGRPINPLLVLDMPMPRKARLAGVRFLAAEYPKAIPNMMRTAPAYVSRYVTWKMSLAGLP